MVALLAFINTSIFFTLGSIHFYWALGGHWGMSVTVPVRENTAEKLFKPTPFGTMLVGVGLYVFGLIALGTVGFLPVPLEYFRWANGIIALIFLMRAIGEFNYIGFFKRVKNTPFADNDTLYYSPVCLLVSGISLVLALAHQS